jgi:hypothetical protein
MMSLKISLRHLLVVLVALPFALANGTGGVNNQNIIPNGDFSAGNTGFTSELPFIKPEFDCLWGGYYTVATKFNEPRLHRLIAPEAFQAIGRSTGKEKVLYANAGGTEPLVLWSAEVKCKPRTRYLLSFYCMSLTGYMVDGNPPHQVATVEWAPDFEISANGISSVPVQAGLTKFYKGSMYWDSQNLTSATIKITRDKFPHGGGLVAISNIQMVPIKE